MYFLALGVIFLLMKLLEIGPAVNWDWYKQWYIFATPFILAFVWWLWADWSGYTKRKAMDKMEQKKQDRLARNREALGIGTAKAAPKKRK
jgi:small Trp-rich protein